MIKSIIIYGWFLVELVDLAVMHNTDEGYRVDSTLIHVKDLMCFIRQHEPVVVYRRGHCYERGLGGA